VTQPKVGDLVLIEWVDIHTAMEWAPLGEDPGLAPCKTVGFVTHVSPRHVAVAACMGVDSIKEHTNTETNLRQGIPWGCVTKWRKLR
jgi:hypothetical protein